MMIHTAALPGFFATTDNALAHDANPAGSVWRRTFGPIDFWHWGRRPMPLPDLTLGLSRVMRDTVGMISPQHIAASLSSNPRALTRLLPPFAAVAAHDHEVTMVADSMGFRHLFHSAAGFGVRPLLTSSSLMAGRVCALELDHTAVAVQSLLGWQLGQRTLFRGIQKLEPGAAAHLTEGGIQIDPSEQMTHERIALDQAVREAADLLRTSLNAILDDHPEAVLQLTGGMDSRLLLSAIPKERRRGLRAMTLDVPGADDIPIASKIAEKYDIRHEVHGLSGVQELEPQQAWDLCVAAAVRLDAMSDPIALAAQLVAEDSFPQGVRISGLGGEVARGFYYTGKARERSYSRSDVERLASWRMFVNDAVEPGLLKNDFSTWAREVAHQQVYTAMVEGGDEWLHAADHLYLRHRMQRWAGATDLAVSDQRVVINPMLDASFLGIAARLAPEDKAESRFLAALQMELDPELGLLPLAGRPAPAAYADPPRWQSARALLSLSSGIARKGVQKLRHGNRPPAGGAAMAAKVAEHWRHDPSSLTALNGMGFVNGEWVEKVIAGHILPRPSSVALVTNLLVSVP